MPLIFLWEVLGGLGLFILGMKSMSEGLQKLAGERLRRSLEKIAGNRLTAALMGSCIASLLQSSSAASILVIGFVNAGLISIYQALGILLGTGLGATIAIQFIAFKVSLFALPAIFLGVLLTFFSKKRRLVYLGNLLLGAGLVYLGLQIMEAGFSPISQNDILMGLQNRYLSWRVSAALIGAILTFLIQSGSAATGLVIAMTGSGLMGYETGAAMVVGEVLGTSLVALVATINGALAAKRTAFLYFLMNAFAVASVLAMFPLFLKVVHLISPGEADYTISNLSSGIHGEASSVTRPYVARYLANAHTLFNLLIVRVFLPLVGFFARSAAVVLPGKKGEVDTEPRPLYIDERVINTPTIALLQAKNELRRMAEITRLMLADVTEQFYRYDAKRSARIEGKRDVLNILQSEISTFLVLLSRQGTTIENSLEISIMLHMVNDLKQMGDQNAALHELLRRKKEDKIVFSGTAMSELKAMAAKLKELVQLSVEAVDKETAGDNRLSQDCRDAIARMQETMLNNHMKRLTGGKCSVAAGVVYSDILSAIDKIADHSLALMDKERELFHAASNGGN
ncbi:MAG TPA: Na/Pi symporter [Geobacteraceae bacterium]